MVLDKDNKFFNKIVNCHHVLHMINYRLPQSVMLAESGVC